ncbi:deoxyribodipyrimidine photo-lyase [Raineyella antarctica]|uniref:Deoxyribodipyrimidine photo-lyase n=1 Tax=Raineyella antarctica TaxID=1577474 RepID=A0A1G6GN96_9ACTN|nr:deoxyribodipyrimidine photo-lyase [Raineyella antarctica]SDB83472.1 deoxyribodipyrimidine photo-lyase [Raineyella antarctica]
MTALLWLRRDLRRADLPALGAAARAAGEDAGVAAVFVVDPEFFEPAGEVRQAWLARTLLALRESYEGRLSLRRGDPVELIPELASAIGATSVHVSRETEPAGAARDARVREQLERHRIAWVETGSPYAVTPGRVVNRQGAGFQVFTPFSWAWRDHGWRAPAEEPEGVRLLHPGGDEDVWRMVTEVAGRPGLPELPEAGEEAALRRWAQFLEHGLADYADHRDRPDLDGTSMMSPYLALGAVHPRTLLFDLASCSGPGATTYATELAWREFYADVLWRHPESLARDLRPQLQGLAYDDDTELRQAWQQGRTGYPIVDAGMRQLLATGWMHNRVRMITASFLTKDLHQWWPAGAAWFEQRLIDADLASNAHGWQWTAGTGTDAAPYFRVFNPVLQGKKFDPDGDYVRRWVPELRHLPGVLAHEPWKSPKGPDQGYPDRIVDHDRERKVTLARYQLAREHADK